MKQSIIDLAAYQCQIKKYAPYYSQVSDLYHEAADRLLDRLSLMRFTPETVLDVGSKDGYSTAFLAKQYPQARITATESSPLWFDQFESSYQSVNATTLVAEPDKLPLEDNSVDCLVSHLSVSWSNNFEQCLAEWRRVLTPEGILLFSCFGVDTLKECKQAFSAIGGNNHVHAFSDMHLVGDAMLAAYYVDPVVHVETLGINYKSLKSLWRDLRYAMAMNVRADRDRGLLTPRRWQLMVQQYEALRNEDGRFPATFEIIYGHALAPDASQAVAVNALGEAVFPIDMIGTYQRNKE